MRAVTTQRSRVTSWLIASAWVGLDAHTPHLWFAFVISGKACRNR